MDEYFKVGVVVPFYNNHDFIFECIDSILSSYDALDLQIVVVDDGSTPPLDFVNGAHIIRQENRGAAAARNTGLNYLRNECCDFIAFCDADDLWLPGKLTQQVSYLARAQSTLAIGSSPIFYDGVFHEKLAFFGKRSMFSYWLLNDIATSSILFRASALEYVEFRNFQRGEDFDFLMQLCRIGPVFKEKASRTVYRYHSNNSSSGLKLKLYKDILTRMEARKSFLPDIFSGKVLLIALFVVVILPIKCLQSIKVKTWEENS